VIAYAIRHLGHRWELVDVVTVADAGPDSFEFGYVLRKSTTDLPSEVRAERLTMIFDDIGLGHGAAAS